MTTSQPSRAPAGNLADEPSIALPGAPPIPGLRARALRDEDWPALAELSVRAHLADGVPWAPDPESLRIEWLGHDGFDPADVVLVEVAGRLVAAGLTEHALQDGVLVHDVRGWVEPDWRRRGLGRALLAENLRRARANIASAARPEPVQLGAWAGDAEAGAIALLEGAGFRPVRWFFLMRRPTLDDVPDLALPAGLEIRPVQPGEVRQILEAENEAFRDHWGHTELTERRIMATLAMPEFDTSLWQVAWAGDEVAGVVQTWIWPSENARLGIRRGWLEHISVRRPWRRLGLARALTARSLAQLRDRDMTDAMLGVDADNPTGALGLYERLGFEIEQRTAGYRRPVDLPDPER